MATVAFTLGLTVWLLGKEFKLRKAVSRARSYRGRGGEGYCTTARGCAGCGRMGVVQETRSNNAQAQLNNDFFWHKKRGELASFGARRDEFLSHPFVIG